ncbi:MAG: penicillin-binding protein, partial [Clostridia bacterium]
APAERLREYTGTFTSGEGDTVSVRFDEETCKLMITVGKEELALRSIGEDAFLFHRLGVDSPVRFVRGQEGKVKRFAFGSRQLQKVEA